MILIQYFNCARLSLLVGGTTWGDGGTRERLGSALVYNWQTDTWCKVVIVNSPMKSQRPSLVKHCIPQSVLPGQVGSLTSPRSGHSCSLLEGGQVLVVGGQGAGHLQVLVMLYMYIVQVLIRFTLRS